MNLVFFTNNLGSGGAEKVMLTLVNYFCRIHKVTVVTIDSGGYYYEMLRDLPIEYHHIKKGKGNTLSYILSFNKILRQSQTDIVFSFLWFPNIINAFANLFSNRKVILSERSNHRIYLSETFKKRFIWKNLLRLAYFRANKIVPNSSRMANYIQQDFNCKLKKIRFIHNGIDFEELERLQSEPVDDYVFDSHYKYIAAVGRLFTPKNYFYLLEVFKGASII